VAKEVEVPVKVLWSREEDIQHDFYRPLTMARMTAGLDASGMPIAWHVQLAGPSILGQFRPEAIKDGLDRHMQEGFLDEMPYDVENILVEYALRVRHSWARLQCPLRAKRRRTALQQKVEAQERYCLIFASSWRGLKGFGT
jgi:CO/xanthine dehydrogenase Mo-binding subunit